MDHNEFPDIGLRMWWALQTVTTVGYGDIVPADTEGRIIGAVLMLQGIGFITVIAASVTAALIEQARKRHNLDDDPATAAHSQADRRTTRCDRAGARSRASRRRQAGRTGLLVLSQGRARP